jgi:SRSO17 transposase
MRPAYAPVTSPPSTQPPTPNLAPRDVAGLADELVAYHARFAPLFPRPEQRHGALRYLQGQMLDLERKAIEPLAHAVEGGNVQALQQFISQSPWDADAVLVAHQACVGETLGDPESGVLILDGCDFPKQGTESVGVARQWCGALGKRANCQASVVACYASDHGHTLVDRRLYLPERWFTPAYAARRRRCGVPPEIGFQTQPDLAWEMLVGLRARGALPFHWVIFDEGFGHNPVLLDRIAAADLCYVAEVPHTTRVWTERPATGVPRGSGRGRRPQRVRVEAGAAAPLAVSALAATLPPSAWSRHTLREGAKGPLVAEIARVRAVAVRDGLPGPAVWVVLRRSLDPQPELKAFLSNAPADTPLATLVRLSAGRWPVERSIEEAKGEVGLDHYEVRGWVGWHHHVTLTFLAHHFLVRARLRLGGKKPGPDRPAGAQPTASDAAPPDTGRGARAHPARLHPAAESHRLLLPSQTHPPAPPRFVVMT